MDGPLGDPLGLPEREHLEIARVQHLGRAELRARRLRRSPGSTTVIGPMPSATKAAMESAPMGPAPITVTLSPRLTPDQVIPCRATASGSANAARRAVKPGGSRNSEAARTST